MLNEWRFVGDRLIVTADYLDESVQPWGNAPCFRYIVRVSAPEGDWSSYAYGSQVDYANDDYSHTEEMGWMVLGDLLDAYWDPDVFFELAVGEPDLRTLDKVRKVLEVIDYAAKIGERLTDYAEDIRAGQDGETVSAEVDS